MNRWVWVTVVGVGLMRCGPVDGAAEEPTSQPGVAVEIEAQPGNGAEPEAAVTAFDGWVLSGEDYPEGVDDEAGYLAYVEGRIEAFLSAGQEGALPLQELSYQLAAANWMLSRKIEPTISRLLLGIERPGDMAALLSGLERAQLQLAACKTALEAIPPAQQGQEDGSDPDENAFSLEGLQRSVEGLSAFATAIGAAWPADEAPREPKAVRRAASALGVLLEDERAAVAQLAGLYRAMLYGRMGRSERALSSLEPALAPLPAEDRAVGLYNRLLRCQLLAQQGGHVVAWSLLLRLEERVTEWFGSPEQSAQAGRAVGLVRLAVARQWQRRLQADGAKTEAKWCKNAADDLEVALKKPGGTLEVLRLGSAVPLLIQPDLVEGVQEVRPPQTQP